VKGRNPPARHAQRNGIWHTFLSSGTYTEVIMSAEHRLTEVLGERNIKA
jgi:hypothetical protein